MMTPPHRIHQTWRRDHLRATPTDMTMLGHGDTGNKSGWRVMQCCVFAVVAITLWWTVKYFSTCLLIRTPLNMWASIPILSPWFRMVWDAASAYNLYLATPLGHIARNLLFHTNYFERLCWFLSVFPSLVAQGCVSKLGDPLNPTRQMFEPIFKEISFSLLPLVFAPSSSISLSMIELCPHKYVLTDILTQGLSPEVFLSKQSSIIQSSPFFLLFIRIHRSIHSSNQILQSHPFQSKPIKSIRPFQSVCHLA